MKQKVAIIGKKPLNPMFQKYFGMWQLKVRDFNRD